MKELIAQVQQLEAAKAAAEARAKDAEYTTHWKNMVDKVEDEMRKVLPGVITWGCNLPGAVARLVAEVLWLRETVAHLAPAPAAGSSGAQPLAQPLAVATGDSAGHSDGAAVDALADIIRARARDYNVSLVKAQKWIEGAGALCLAQKALDKGSYKWIEATVGSEEYVRAFLDVLKRIGINAYINDVPGGGFSLKVDMNGVRSWAASSRGA